MSEARPDDRFTAEELDTWSSIATLLEWLPAALDAQMQEESGISHFEYGILFALSRSEQGVLRMSELASYANSTLSRLSRAVARLERRGWVKRDPDPSDGRATVAAITEAGAHAAQSATPGHVALVRSLVFASLSPSQARQLGESSRRILAAMGDEGRWRSAN